MSKTSLIHRLKYKNKLGNKWGSKVKKRNSGTLKVVERLKEVIVEKAERSDIPNIDKKKYLVPTDLTVGQFVYVLINKILEFFCLPLRTPSICSFFVAFTVGFATAGVMMSAIYEEKKDEDGFLYVTYSGENTFGFEILP
ncbi:hypothetical protein GIB67_010673 [Kingdonia uniflora]|uniref:Autophagy-related protein n=1 Tax=Kingdonia uniflora TaxID=39325 RepID=A0A7J7LT51_9MAGN|nr:hypothetical protein GIB67_010673 [Kingdonia uniflora]